MRSLIPIVLVLVVVGGCRRETPVPEVSGPEGWSRLPDLRDDPHPWGRYLNGRIIALDPGHGGAHGDQGWGFEGPVNLAVAEALTGYLERDGAVVVVTRTRDVEVPLAERPRIAERNGAEIFVSIHHNAVDNETSNYTSTWYHGDPPGEEPANLDLARAIQARMLEALRTPHKVPAPLLSDKLVARNSGFRVLRDATMPAVLCEASFYTHPEERARLQDPDYIRREAYAYYLGLVDYFTGGTPHCRVAATSSTRRGRRILEVALSDGLRERGGWGSEKPRILPASIVCRIGGRPVPFEYDPVEARLRFDAPSGRLPARLELHFQNIYKHSNFPTRFDLEVDAVGNVALAARRRSR